MSDERMSMATLEEYRRAPNGEGRLGAAWQDKPHRLLYDLIAEVLCLRTENETLRRERDAECAAGVHRTEQLVAAERLVAARDARIAELEARLSGLVVAGRNLALATPDRVLRAELERFVRLASEVLP